ncbi:polyketide cyclase [Mycolicibacterium mageritense]|uniref:polyketide cyclase n=1 Tax=Mycolicibacterium mageritense TaxID=53462 RepID=UPI001E2BA9F0|nr:polyketide cyclase [Mycolicibacterium mageritense]
MAEETMAATTVVNASAEAVFDVLADPSSHAAIDGTGWVRQAVDTTRLTKPGQLFRMGMYHENHPCKLYEMTNRIEQLDRPRVIAWMPGAQPRYIPGRQGADDDAVEYGGWIWRYDLKSVGADQTEVTLTYDWSRVRQPRPFEFPPFPREHLVSSLEHLASLVRI